MDHARLIRFSNSSALVYMIPPRLGLSTYCSFFKHEENSTVSFILAETPSLDHRMLTDLDRWDDWVTEERLRKLTEENRELAAHLKRNLEASLRLKQTKSSSKKRATSDRSSVRDSEDPSSAMAPFQRGNKRARGDQHLQSVSDFRCCCLCETALPKACPTITSLLLSLAAFVYSHYLRVPHPSALFFIILHFLNHLVGRQHDHLRSQ